MRVAQALRQLNANRPLAALVYASAISGAGDWIYLTAFPVLVYERTGSPALVGVAAVGRMVPFFALSMPAGIAADRFAPRSILILTETVRCLAMLLVAGLCVVGTDVVWPLLLTMVAAAAGTFSMPAMAALAPELARNDDELGRANAIRATLDSLAGVAGPAFAGALIVVGGLPIAFALNGASFAVVALALCIWRTAPGQQARLGVVVISEHQPPVRWGTLLRRIAGPLALDGAISFGSAATGVLAVLIAVQWLGAGASFTGALNAAAGVGGIVGGLAAGAVVNGNARLGVIGGITAFAAALALMSLVPLPVLAVAVMAMAFGALVLLDTLNGTAIQRLTVEGDTGRATGILHTCAALWMMAGAILPTLFVWTLGIQAAILAPALVMFALGGLALLSQPMVRLVSRAGVTLGSPA